MRFLVILHIYNMKHLVVFTGAGISAESGIKTFRDSDGLWETYDIYEVATPEAWRANQALVLGFYNARRQQLKTVQPNAAHTILASLETHFKVSIITQNVDDLHERAGSTSVMHLHGELRKVRSDTDPNYIKDWGYNDVELGQKCPAGGQLRPHVVWFGEDVPKMPEAEKLAETAEIFVVIGTALNVYPAAGLVHYVPKSTPVFLIDPQPVATNRPYTHVKEKASVGMKILKDQLMKDYTY